MPRKLVAQQGGIGTGKIARWSKDGVPRLSKVV